MSQTFLLASRLFIGLLFVATGVSKIPIFDEFVYSVGELIPLTGVYLQVLSITAIMIEVTAGTALIFRIQTRVFALILSMLIIGFIIVLSATLFRHQEYICKCFGVLGLELPVTHQIAIDGALLLISLSIVLFDTSKSMLPELSKYHSRTLFAIASSAGGMWIGLVFAQPVWLFGERSLPGYDYSAIDAYIEQRYGRDDAYPRLLFMVEMSDFLCPSCREEFVAMGEKIADAGNRVHSSVTVIVRDIPFMTREEQQIYMNQWVSDNYYPLFMEYDGTGLFEQAEVEKLTVILYGSDGEILEVRAFPMGLAQSLEIVDRFFEILSTPPAAFIFPRENARDTIGVHSSHLQ